MAENAKEFVKNFDSKSEADVMWLKRVGEITVKSMEGSRVDISKVINDNPIKGHPKMNNPIDWAYVHFQLCMKYANAVLNEDAFVPGSK
jgi:hypothetical protein